MTTAIWMTIINLFANMLHTFSGVVYPRPIFVFFSKKFSQY